MSKNNKQANKRALAKQFRMTRGPARTTAKHGKQKAWWQVRDPSTGRLAIYTKDRKRATASTTTE